jgi:MATE family multidrug resistance protein
VFCGVVFVAGAAVLLRAFTPDLEVQRVGARLLYVAAVFELLDAVKVVTCAVLRGTGDVRVPAAVNIASAWTLVPALTWLLGVQLHLGAVGGWLALCCNLAFTAAFVSLRLARGRWLPAAQRSRDRATPLSVAAHAS